MDTSNALAAFSALSQPMRLAVFRLLIAKGPSGMAAGDIAAQLGVRQNTLSANLSILLAAGLITNQRRGRSILYTADMQGTRALLGFLLHDCCGGNPALCLPALDDAAPQSQAEPSHAA